MSTVKLGDPVNTLVILYQSSLKTSLSNLLGITYKVLTEDYKTSQDTASLTSPSTTSHGHHTNPTTKEPHRCGAVLRHSRRRPASGFLHGLFPLPEMLCPWILLWLVISLPSALCLNVTFLVRPHPQIESHLLPPLVLSSPSLLSSL